jgi:phosphomannomutase
MSDICVLFDMDGTLTPPRSKITEENIFAIKKLLRICRVGVVTGSDKDFAIEQIGMNLFSMGLELFPCNGTKHYVYEDDKEILVSKADSIKTVIGEINYNKLIKEILKLQINCIDSGKISCSGNFISYRDSVLNWSPIGRHCSDEDRSNFEIMDISYNIREDLFKDLCSITDRLDLKNLSIKIAGSTSFDIYPAGYDKTYALRSFKSIDDIWFVGDRCGENGNDKEIAEKLSGRSFCVSSFREIPAISDQIYNEIRKK